MLAFSLKVVCILCHCKPKAPRKKTNTRPLPYLTFLKKKKWSGISVPDFDLEQVNFTVIKNKDDFIHFGEMQYLKINILNPAVIW